MKYYIYSDDTKEFVGEGIAQESPREPGVFLLPRNATFVKPAEAPEGMVQCWRDNAWELVEDNRGAEFWNTGDKWDTPPQKMTVLGPFPDGALLSPPEKSPEELTAEAMRQAKASRSDAVSRITVEVDGMMFDGDEKSQDRMSRAITMFTSSGLPADTTTAWVLADNTVAKVTIDQLTQALLLAGQKQTELWTIPYEDAA